MTNSNDRKPGRVSRRTFLVGAGAGSLALTMCRLEGKAERVHPPLAVRERAQSPVYDDYTHKGYFCSTNVHEAENLEDLVVWIETKEDDHAEPHRTPHAGPDDPR